MQNIREKLKRKLSLHDKNPNLDEEFDPEDVDEETCGHLHREIEKAEEANEPLGRPGTFLNRLISHGNLKTEKQIAAEHEALKQQASSKENQKPQTSST
ncbi:hypothetical protein LTR85_004619 [Meristemomyces frigidus]|nr:hypothetical protein LTR85_004619 [Meristemomyces frigidus]